MKNKILFIMVGIFFLAQLSTAKAFDIFHVDLDDDFVAEVLATFPETKEINSEWISYNVDPNIHLNSDASVTVTFIHEGAWYKNQFGYFTYEDSNHSGDITLNEILEQEIIFENSSLAGSGGDLETGDSVEIGPFPAGTNIGFFLIADGYQSPKATYYTLDELNPDGFRHLAMVATSNHENIALGIEDKPYLTSDKDFNDVIFTFTTEDKEIIEEIIEDGNIPSNDGSEGGEGEEGDEGEEDEGDSDEGDEEEPEDEGEAEEQDEEVGEEAPALDGSNIDEVWDGNNAQTIEESALFFHGSGTAGCSLQDSAPDTMNWMAWIFMLLGVRILGRISNRVR